MLAPCRLAFSANLSAPDSQPRAASPVCLWRELWRPYLYPRLLVFRHCVTSFGPDTMAPPGESQAIIPNFERFFEQEHTYPQHGYGNPGRDGRRYLYVSNQHWGEESVPSRFCLTTDQVIRSWMEQHFAERVSSHVSDSPLTH
jgi:hypothetical protein